MDAHFHDPTARAVFSDQKMSKVNLFESPRLFCDVYCLEPGQAQAEHTHQGSDKVYFALSGTCQVRVGGETRELQPGQVAVAPSGVAHAVTNASGRRALLLVVMAPHPSFKG
jgi:quercetin dioxygenase-like cupin family protein